jgi:hypothetical protein
MCQVREQFRRIPYQTFLMLELIRLSRFIAPEQKKIGFMVCHSESKILCMPSIIDALTRVNFNTHSEKSFHSLATSCVNRLLSHYEKGQRSMLAFFENHCDSIMQKPFIIADSSRWQQATKSIVVAVDRNNE